MENFTEKLTLEIVMKYSKAKIRYGEHDFMISGIDLLDNNLAIRNEKENLWTDVSISDCKLILRPSSSLTDEEKNVLKKINVDYIYYDIEINDRTIKSIDYLRSINIDIDGLYKRGLCVYE